MGGSVSPEYSVGVPFINALGRDTKKQLVDNSVELNLMDVKAHEQETAPPPPPPPPPTLQQQVQRMSAPVVVDSVEEEVELATTDEMVQTTTNDIVQDDVVVVEQQVQTTVEESPVEFYLVEEKPTFHRGDYSGDEAILKYIKENTKYPEEPRNLGIEGRVFVFFVINQVGKVEQVRIERGVTPELDLEAMRVISLMPDWIPGKQGGQPVKVSYVIPIYFILKN